MSDYGCSSRFPLDTERQAVWAAQRASRGFDDTELWNLDITIAKFILPRIKSFRGHLTGYPAQFTSIKDWESILDKIIKGLELLCSEEAPLDVPPECQEAIDLLHEHYFNLWN